jgi:hypothetical protein
MDKLIMFVIVALSLNAALMVQAYATTTVLNTSGPAPSDVNDNGSDVVSTYTAFVTAIGTLVGTIGSIIGVAVVFIRDTKTKALAQQVGLGMVTFGQKTVENTDRIRNLAKVAYDLSPEEAKQFLEQNRMKMEQLTESVNRGSEQLEVIKDNMPGDTTAKISAWRKTLPHEPFDTRPGAV